MTRHYSNLVNENIKALLGTLVDRDSSPAIYQQTMFQLGVNLGDVLLSKISNSHDEVCLACTVEDADFLAKGVLTQLERRLTQIAFVCFWNQRFSPFEIEDLQIAPIIRKYQEPIDRIRHLIVLKSVISGTCVVRTNLADLVQRTNPETIFIVAPVIYQGAEQRLADNFPEAIYRKFQFLYLAADQQRTLEGEVIPGIGGMIYDRLGFDGQADKNKYIPEIVKSRRAKFISA